MNEKNGVTKKSQHQRFASVTTILAYGLIVASIICIIVLVYNTFSSNTNTPPRIEGESLIEWVIIYYTSPFFACIGAFLGLSSGLLLLWNIKSFITDTIPEDDREFLVTAISNGNTKALLMYIHLSSLKGFTGTFTHLGITGLPLATVSMTILFCTFAFLLPNSSGEANGELMDLAKLSLGAFIASFVHSNKHQKTEIDALNLEVDKK